MTETTPGYDIEADLVLARVKAARAVAETLRSAETEAVNAIDELSRLVESYRLRERVREVRGE